MPITNGGLIQDLDSLSYEVSSPTGTTELSINPEAFTISLTRVGNLTADGVTLRALYSKLKEVWSSDPILIRFPFPMVPITDEQFEFSNGWDLDKEPNLSTTITHGGTNSGTSGEFTISTDGDFVSSNVVPDMIVSGTGIAEDARVVNVTSDTVTLSLANTGNVSGDINFWSDNDYTFNLIRTGGWALQSVDGVLQEEWIGVISLGNLGAEATNKTLAIVSDVSNSDLISLANTTGLQVGSFVTGPQIPHGTQIIAVNSPTEIQLSKPTTIVNGGLITIRPRDQVYYQIGSEESLPINFALTGAINQAVKTFGNEDYGDFDFRGADSVLRLFVREQAFTYGTQRKEDIGNTTLTSQVYRFPVSNASDAINITHEDIFIDSDQDNIPDVAPYSNMSITWYDTPQTRSIGGIDYPFSIIIDADTSGGSSGNGPATAEEIYEFVQWSLRRGSGVDIDAGVDSRLGLITRDMLEFVGDSLFTLHDPNDGFGIFIDNFSSADTNRITFADDNGINRQFPFTAAGNISFNSNLVTDGTDAIYRLFFRQLNGRSFGSRDAEIVRNADNVSEIAGFVSGSSISFDFDYDGNPQAAWQPNTDFNVGDEYRIDTTWYRVETAYTSGSTVGDIDHNNSTTIGGPSVILVAIGLSNSQYVSSESSINRSITNTLSAVAALERNYTNPIPE